MPSLEKDDSSAEEFYATFGTACIIVAPGEANCMHVAYLLVQMWDVKASGALLHDRPCRKAVHFDEARWKLFCRVAAELVNCA